jgi:uncharacterized repeat protein (TIGR01451 family)
VTLNGTPSSVAVGATVTYSVTVKNNGSAAAGSVTLGDVVPTGMTLVSAGTKKIKCSGTGTVSCDLGRLKSHDSTSVSVSARANVAGTMTDVANASSSTPDSNPANNTASVTTNVGTSAAFQSPFKFVPPWLH